MRRKGTERKLEIGRMKVGDLVRRNGRWSLVVNVTKTTVHFSIRRGVELVWRSDSEWNKKYAVRRV